MGGVFTSAPAAVSSGPNHIDVFGRGTDNAIWHTYWDGSWHGFDSLGGTFVSAPSVSSWGGGRLDVFAVGTDSGLYHNYWDGNWHSWGDRLSVTFTSAPAATSWGTGRIDVFAQNSDNTIWHAIWNGTSWSLPESLGGSFAPLHLQLRGRQDAWTYLALVRIMHSIITIGMVTGMVGMIALIKVKVCLPFTSGSIQDVFLRFR